ncbi:MAG: hypothetical protein ACK5XN_39615 [Bacteroidota bacterium]
MSCIILAATTIEIAPFMDTLRNKNIVQKIPNVDVLIGGIGLTATTYALTKYLHIKRPDNIIQVGVGGCFDSSITLGSVVAVKNETIADQSVMELKTLKTLFDLKLLPEEQVPFRKGKQPNDTALLKT